jgi:carbon-monoxide dehydrogenase large subunit
VTAYRGAGRPGVSYLVSGGGRAARELGADPVELRRRNLIPKEAFPYRTPVGSTYDSGDPPGQLALAVEHSDWKRFESRRRGSAETGEKTARHRLRDVHQPSGGGAARRSAGGDLANRATRRSTLLSGPPGRRTRRYFRSSSLRFLDYLLSK